MKKEEIENIIKEDNVKFLKLMFVDLLGKLKTVEVWSGELESVLKNKIMIDGSNIKGLSSVDCADMMLCPDIDSFRRLPFYDSEFGGVAMFMCDLAEPNGSVAKGCVRSNLKRELEKMRSVGFEDMNVGFEPEFFIFKKKPVALVKEKHFVDFEKYDSSECSDVGGKIIKEVMCQFEKMGINNLTGHHECAPSQFELTYKYSDALKACDNIVLARLLIKDIAKKYGCRATFMPKPVSHLAGSGLHTNVSLLKEGKNAFASAEGISETGRKFISGILTHAEGLCFLTNPTINSYKRLISGFEAPVNICWSMANRSAMIRVPKTSGESCRAEVRNVDSTSNPYLAVAGILAAGLDGIKNGMPVAAVDHDIFRLNEEEKSKLNLACLPTNLSEAIEKFELDMVVGGSMTVEIAEKLVEIKKKEVYEYNKLVNSFDFDNYF